MARHLITIPVDTDLDPSTILDFALEFAEGLSRQTGEDVTQDEDETAVESECQK